MEWVGELYFEFHRGTYTTQAKNKLWNRRSEEMLHDIEFLHVLSSLFTTATDSATSSKDLDKIDELWKIVLLNQFHDVIPGSSIALVYKDSTVLYQQVFTQGAALLSSSSLIPTPFSSVSFSNCQEGL